MFKLLVSGAVTEPGFITVSPLSRLDDVIESAKGFHQLAKEFEIKITRENGDEKIVNFHKYLLTGDLNSNPTFLEGDRIYVPFGEIGKNSIVTRGSVVGAGYDIIAKGENLENYIKREIIFSKDADLENVKVSRKKDNISTQLTINAQKFSSTILQPGDIINFMYERGITVTGFVQTPGGFSYYPGYSVSDYIALAGGNTMSGNPEAATVRHVDGEIEKGSNINVRRGDVIYVPRTRKDVFFGELSVLEVSVAFLTIYLTYLSSVK
jgi:protein involved in polysaccharide export with SLBB domain